MIRRKADDSIGFRDFQRKVLEKKERKALEELAQIMRKKRRKVEKCKKSSFRVSSGLGKNDSVGANKEMQIDSFDAGNEQAKEKEPALKKFEKYVEALKTEDARVDYDSKETGKSKMRKRNKKMKKLDRKMLKKWEEYVRILSEKDAISHGNFDDYAGKMRKNKSGDYSGNGFGNFLKKLGDAFVKEFPSLLKTLVKAAIPLVVGILTKDKTMKKQVAT